jgi:hypothetical protein
MGRRNTEATSKKRLGHAPRKMNTCIYTRKGKRGFGKG